MRLHQRRGHILAGEFRRQRPEATLAKGGVDVVDADLLPVQLVRHIVDQQPGAEIVVHTQAEDELVALRGDRRPDRSGERRHLVALQQRQVREYAGRVMRPEDRDDMVLGDHLDVRVRCRGRVRSLIILHEKLYRSSLDAAGRVDFLDGEFRAFAHEPPVRGKLGCQRRRHAHGDRRAGGRLCLPRARPGHHRRDGQHRGGATYPIRRQRSSGGLMMGHGSFPSVFVNLCDTAGCRRAPGLPVSALPHSVGSKASRARNAGAITA